MHNKISRLCRILALALPLLLTATMCASGSDAAEQSPLKKVADIPLPGAAVRFDYQSLDTSRGRLYIAHMNANQLVVFDVKRRAVVANLPTAFLAFTASGQFHNWAVYSAVCHEISTLFNTASGGNFTI